MGRYYRIEIGVETAAPPNGGSPSLNSGAVYTNLVNGREDPGAPRVELDIAVAPLYAPVGTSRVTVWGVGLKTISQVTDFSGAPIKVFGGMQNGLPFATAAVANNQQRLLTEGFIFQCYGNWIGLNQNINFIIQPTAGGTFSKPANLVVNWKKGDSLSESIKNTLKTAFPNIDPPNIEISSQLSIAQDHLGAHFSTVDGFSSWLQQHTMWELNPNGAGPYKGVWIFPKGNTFYVTDNSNPAITPTELQVQDIIGQPTWLDVATIQFNTVMRGDLTIGDYVKFPQALALQTINSPQSDAVFRSKAAFQGAFQISDIVRHIGDSRGVSADQWVSSFQAFALNSAASSVIGSAIQ